MSSRHWRLFLRPVDRLDAVRPGDRVAPARIRAGRCGPAGSDYAGPSRVVEGPFGTVCARNRTDGSQPHPVGDDTDGGMPLAASLDRGAQERVRCRHLSVIGLARSCLEIF